MKILNLQSPFVNGHLIAYPLRREVKDVEAYSLARRNPGIRGNNGL